MSEKSYVGLYGAQQLVKQYCSKCSAYSFVLDGKLKCCGKHTISQPTNYKRESDLSAGRRHLSKVEQNRLLNQQEFKCFYCNRDFNSLVFRKGNAIRLQTEFDHLVPHSYSYNNLSSNFVAACHICNGLKSSLVFDTLEQAQVYLQNKWVEKKYYD